MRRRINDVVALVGYRGFTTFEFAIPTEVFGLDRPEVGDLYELRIVAAEPGPLVGAFGVTVAEAEPLDTLIEAGTIVVPGWRDRFEPPPTALVDALVEAHSRGARLISVCSGAFVLAATGLLDGRTATTHWMYAEDLARLFPRIRVDPTRLYVDEGSVLTSAGSAAGLDACLHLVREDWGPRVANIVARRLVISPHRDGGQAQHIDAPVPDPSGSTDLSSLVEWIEAHLDQPLSLEVLADQAQMSSRTLRRRFLGSTGVSPGRWVLQRRLARAQLLLETSELSIEAVARAAGFGTAVSLRHHFRTRLQTSPSAYRARYTLTG